MAKKSEKDKEKKDKKEKKLKKAGEKKSNKGKKSGKSSTQVSAEERLDMIATAAFYIAEKHGFDPKRVTQDWHEAELQIDAMLKPGKMS